MDNIPLTPTKATSSKKDTGAAADDPLHKTVEKEKQNAPHLLCVRALTDIEREHNEAVDAIRRSTTATHASSAQRRSPGSAPSSPDQKEAKEQNRSPPTSPLRPVTKQSRLLLGTTDQDGNAKVVTLAVGGTSRHFLSSRPATADAASMRRQVVAGESSAKRRSPSPSPSFESANNNNDNDDEQEPAPDKFNELVLNQLVLHREAHDRKRDENQHSLLTFTRRPQTLVEPRSAPLRSYASLQIKALRRSMEQQAKDKEVRAEEVRKAEEEFQKRVLATMPIICGSSKKSTKIEADYQERQTEDKKRKNSLSSPRFALKPTRPATSSSASSPRQQPATTISLVPAFDRPHHERKSNRDDDDDTSLYYHEQFERHVQSVLAERKAIAVETERQNKINGTVNFVRANVEAMAHYSIDDELNKARAIASTRMREGVIAQQTSPGVTISGGGNAATKSGAGAGAGGGDLLESSSFSMTMSDQAGKGGRGGGELLAPSPSGAIFTGLSSYVEQRMNDAQYMRDVTSNNLALSASMSTFESMSHAQTLKEQYRQQHSNNMGGGASSSLLQSERLKLWQVIVTIISSVETMQDRFLAAKGLTEKRVSVHLQNQSERLERMQNFSQSLTQVPQTWRTVLRLIRDYVHRFRQRRYSGPVSLIARFLRQQKMVTTFSRAVADFIHKIKIIQRGVRKFLVMKRCREALVARMWLGTEMRTLQMNVDSLVSQQQRHQQQGSGGGNASMTLLSSQHHHASFGSHQHHQQSAAFTPNLHSSSANLFNFTTSQQQHGHHVTNNQNNSHAMSSSSPFASTINVFDPSATAVVQTPVQLSYVFIQNRDHHNQSQNPQQQNADDNDDDHDDPRGYAMIESYDTVTLMIPQEVKNALGGANAAAASLPIASSFDRQTWIRAFVHSSIRKRRDAVANYVRQCRFHKEQVRRVSLLTAQGIKLSQSQAMYVSEPKPPLRFLLPTKVELQDAIRIARRATAKKQQLQLQLQQQQQQTGVSSPTASKATPSKSQSQQQQLLTSTPIVAARESEQQQQSLGGGVFVLDSAAASHQQQQQTSQSRPPSSPATRSLLVKQDSLRLMTGEQFTSPPASPTNDAYQQQQQQQQTPLLRVSSPITATTSMTMQHHQQKQVRPASSPARSAAAAAGATGKHAAPPPASSSCSRPWSSGSASSSSLSSPTSRKLVVTNRKKGAGNSGGGGEQLAPRSELLQEAWKDYVESFKRGGKPIPTVVGADPRIPPVLPDHFFVNLLMNNSYSSDKGGDKGDSSSTQQQQKDRQQQQQQVTKSRNGRNNTAPPPVVEVCDLQTWLLQSYDKEREQRLGGIQKRTEEDDAAEQAELLYLGEVMKKRDQMRCGVVRSLTPATNEQQNHKSHQQEDGSNSAQHKLSLVAEDLFSSADVVESVDALIHRREREEESGEVLLHLTRPASSAPSSRVGSAHKTKTTQHSYHKSSSDENVDDVNSHDYDRVLVVVDDKNDKNLGIQRVHIPHMLHSWTFEDRGHFSHRRHVIGSPEPASNVPRPPVQKEIEVMRGATWEEAARASVPRSVLTIDDKTGAPVREETRNDDDDDHDIGNNNNNEKDGGGDNKSNTTTHAGMALAVALEERAREQQKMNSRKQQEDTSSNSNSRKLPPSSPSPSSPRRPPHSSSARVGGTVPLGQRKASGSNSAATSRPASAAVSTSEKEKKIQQQQHQQQAPLTSRPASAFSSTSACTSTTKNNNNNNNKMFVPAPPTTNFFGSSSSNPFSSSAGGGGGIMAVPSSTTNLREKQNLQQARARFFAPRTTSIVSLSALHKKKGGKGNNNNNARNGWGSASKVNFASCADASTSSPFLSSAAANTNRSASAQKSAEMERIACATSMSSYGDAPLAVVALQTHSKTAHDRGLKRLAR